jgi:hypothetical protein
VKFIPNAVAIKAARTVLQARKHSPIIMFSVGVAGSLTATVLACRSTLKLEEVLAQAEDKRNELKHAGETNPPLKSGGVYTKDDSEDDLRKHRLNTIIEIGKLYAPAVALGVVSYGLLTGAHVVLTKRNTAITAAYVAVDRAFKEYRERVRRDVGEEKDLEYRFGSIEKEIVEEGEHGHEVNRVKRINPVTGKSMYAVVFDDTNKNWVRAPGANRLFVQAQQSWANDLLNARGHVFLNDVYDLLGLERTPAGAVVGWVKGHGDGYITFMLDDNKREVYDFFEGNEKSVWLDFNVDGVVYDLI